MKRFFCAFLVFIGITGTVNAQSDAQAIMNQGISAYYSKQFEKARSFFKKACYLKSENSCTSLGFIYLGSEWGVRNACYS